MGNPLHQIVQYLAGKAYAAGDQGPLPLAVRKDAATDLALANGNTAPFQVDATGNLRVTASGTAAGTPTSATATVTSVNDQATNATLLASNANRKGATFHNDSPSILYLKLGASATLTSFTAKLLQDDYFEVPFGYTGIVDGIWSADAAGAVRVTELT